MTELSKGLAYKFLPCSLLFHLSPEQASLLVQAGLCFPDLSLGRSGTWVLILLWEEKPSFSTNFSAGCPFLQCKNHQQRSTASIMCVQT